MDMRIYISYDKSAYSDPELEQVKSGLHLIKNSTKLPKGVYFSNTEYIGQAESSNGELLHTVRFTYPDHIIGNTLSVNTGAIYDEEV